jgi:type I restriction enzyme S subunit
MVPNGWDSSKLRDIAKIKSGSTPLRAKGDIYFTKKGTPWIKTLDLNNQEIIRTQEQITNLALKETSCSIFPVDTVLVAMYGGFNQIGRTGLLTTPSAINQALSGLIIDPTKANPKYILNYLNGNIPQWKKFAASSRKDPNITREDVCGFIVLLPPLPEQQKIATILGTWNKAISTTERLIDNSKQQKKALMQQLLTGDHTQRKRLLDDTGKPFEGEWAKVELGKLLDYKQPTPYLVKSTDYSDEYSTPVLTAGKTFILGYSNEDFGVFKEELPAIIFDDFTTASKFVDFPFKAKSSAMKILVAKQGVSIKFVYEAMQVLNYPIGGHQRHWISIFANLVIGLPSPEEQQKIAAVLTNADKEVELLEQQLSDLKQEKKALMQQLLTGKRRVKIKSQECIA